VYTFVDDNKKQVVVQLRPSAKSKLKSQMPAHMLASLLITR